MLMDENISRGWYARSPYLAREKRQPVLAGEEGYEREGNGKGEEDVDGDAKMLDEWLGDRCKGPTKLMRRGYCDHRWIN